MKSSELLESLRLIGSESNEKPLRFWLDGDLLDLVELRIKAEESQLKLVLDSGVEVLSLAEAKRSIDNKVAHLEDYADLDVVASIGSSTYSVAMIDSSMEDEVHVNLAA